MTTFVTAKQRYRSEQTRKAMQRMVYHCPFCRRGQNKNPIDISGFGDLLWVCRYCKHEWTVADRSAHCENYEQNVSRES